jgi:hypothetical protein
LLLDNCHRRYYPEEKGYKMKRVLIILIVGLLVLAGCSAGPLKQLNNSPSYQDWDDITNPSWESEALEAKVIELAQDYRSAAGQGVCWDMAVGFWQFLKENDIVSMLAVGKSEIDNWGETSVVLSHVWVIVIGADGLIIPFEYAVPRFPGDSRFEALTTGYFYRDPEALQAEYPEIFY